VKKLRKKTEELYTSLLPMRIVTFDDIVQLASKKATSSTNRRYIYRKYVKRLVEAEKLQPIRKRLYAVLNPLEKPEKHETDKLLIASKIRKKYYLGYHTALEYYGSAYSAFNEAYVCIQARDRFDPFNYGRFTFKPVFTKDILSQILKKPYGQSFLRVSSKERTFVECIDRVQYAGGWEECIKSLAELKGIDYEKLVALTLNRGKQILFRKVGYFLEYLRNTSPFYEHISQDLLEKLKKQVKGSPQYLARREPGELNARWRLYIPENLEEKLKEI
jgi:predicted transcriptional regulator of viral defense system